MKSIRETVRNFEHSNIKVNNIFYSKHIFPTENPKCVLILLVMYSFLLSEGLTLAKSSCVLSHMVTESNKTFFFLLLI